MNKKGCYTVAFRSPSFPYFSINTYGPKINEGNFGGTRAFFERLKFIEAYQSWIDGHSVYVDGDCGLFTENRNDAASLRRRFSRWIANKPLLKEGK